MEVKGDIQFRFDPLTHGQTRINPSRATRPKSTSGLDSNLQAVVDAAKSRDPFLPDVIFEKTPKFPPTLGPNDGRIIRGETVVFPNLHPFGINHAVAVMSHAHYLPLTGFSAQQIKDALICSKQYMNAVAQASVDKKQKWYPTLVWNYMPPSAGSIIHPHLQIFVEDEALPLVQEEIDSAANYFKNTNRNYFHDLLCTEEKLNKRFVGKNRGVVVITTFAPRGFSEVQMIFPGVSSLADLSEEQIDDATDAFLKVLKAYDAMGVGSFNMASFSGPVGENREDYWLHLKWFSRPYPSSIYTNDTGPTERMYDVWVINTIPEDIAQIMREVWDK